MMIDNIKYEIIKEKRKSISITIKDGIVVIKSPKFVSNKHIEEIVYKKQEWIHKALERYKNEQHTYVDGEVFKLLGKEYILKVYFENVKKSKVFLEENYINMVMPIKYKGNQDIENIIQKEINKFHTDIAKQMLDVTMEKVTKKVGLYPSKYRLRNLKRAWGNCSSTRNISINIQLIQYSKNAFEYVVLHEVCHLKYMNHSKEFWNMVHMYMNDYKEAEKELKRK